jgi:uncharacterized protein YndB with AHSA1/START domain
MTVTAVHKDPHSLSLTLDAEFDAPPERVWQLWSDPRQLERWWGPPGYPATFDKHDLTPGGEVTYFMTGPDGDAAWGAWRVTAVDPPTSLEFTDAFADADGTPLADSPIHVVAVRLTERDEGTRMQLRSTFDSREDMDKLVSIGMVEGLREAVGQMDALIG